MDRAPGPTFAGRWTTNGTYSFGMTSQCEVVLLFGVGD